MDLSEKCKSTLLISTKFFAYVVFKTDQACLADLQFSDIRFMNSKKARTIESLITTSFRSESFTRARRHAARLLSDRRWKATEVNFPSEFLSRIISPSSYNLPLPLAIVSTHSASSPLAAPLALNRFRRLIAHS